MAENFSFKEIAYRNIKEQILNCNIMPGTIISDKEYAEEMGVGRTPVREALLMLQREGLVVIKPRSCVYASEITERDVTEIYQIRNLLEPTVAVSIKSGISKVRLLEMSEQLKKIDIENHTELYNADGAFHRFIIEASNNRKLISFYDDILMQQYRIGLYNVKQKKYNSVQQTIGEHDRIVHAIISENDAEIYQSIREHINSSLIASLNALHESKSKI